MPINTQDNGPVNAGVAEEKPQVVINPPTLEQGCFTLAVFGQMPDSALKVFTPKEVKDKAQNKIGENWAMLPKKEIAKALGLTHKDDAEALKIAIRDTKAEAMRFAKGMISSLDADWVLQRLAFRTLSDGTRQIMLTTREEKEQLIADEKIARQWGCTVEKVQEMRMSAAAQRRAQAAATVDVKSEIVPPAALPPVSEEEQAEQ